MNRIKTAKEIEEEIETIDEQVLIQYLDYVHKCFEWEHDRGRGAEVRATATLAILGVLAALFVPQYENIPSSNQVGFWFIIVSYSVPLMFLLYGIFYAIRVLMGRVVYLAESDSVLQTRQTMVDALRMIIALRIFERAHLMEPNSYKLWFLERSQRCVFFAIISLVIFVIGMVFRNVADLGTEDWVAWLYLFISILVMVLERKFVPKHWSV